MKINTVQDLLKETEIVKDEQSLEFRESLNIVNDNIVDLEILELINIVSQGKEQCYSTKSHV